MCKRLLVDKKITIYVTYFKDHFVKKFIFKLLMKTLLKKIVLICIVYTIKIFLITQFNINTSLSSNEPSLPHNKIFIHCKCGHVTFKSAPPSS